MSAPASTTTTLGRNANQKKIAAPPPAPRRYRSAAEHTRPPSGLFVAARLNLDPCGPAFVSGVASKVAPRAVATNSDRIVTR
jgi:hypothetical protein